MPSPTCVNCKKRTGIYTRKSLYLDKGVSVLVVLGYGGLLVSSGSAVDCYLDVFMYYMIFLPSGV